MIFMETEDTVLTDNSPYVVSDTTPEVPKVLWLSLLLKEFLFLFDLLAMANVHAGRPHSLWPTNGDCSLNASRELLLKDAEGIEHLDTSLFLWQWVQLDWIINFHHCHLVKDVIVLQLLSIRIEFRRISIVFCLMIPWPTKFRRHWTDRAYKCFLKLHVYFWLRT